MKAHKRQIAEERSVELVTLLVEARADLEDGGDVSPVLQAVLAENLAVVQALIACGVSPGSLSEVVGSASAPIIRELVDAEANPFIPDKDGNTSMELAISRKDQEILTLVRDYIGRLERERHPHCQTVSHRPLGRPMLQEAASSFASQKTILLEAKAPDSSAWRAEVNTFLQGCDRIQKRPLYVRTMLLMLLVAIFLPELWTIMYMTNTSMLDIIVALIVCFFALDILMQIAAYGRRYCYMPHLWLDLTALVALLLDHSVVMKYLESLLVQGPAVPARTAKILRVRRMLLLSRLVHWRHFFPQVKIQKSMGKKLANQFSEAASQMVLSGIVTMLVIVPCIEFFRYPSAEHSFAAWVALISSAARNYPDDVSSVILDMQEFYTNLDYHPYLVHYAFGNGSTSTIRVTNAKVPAAPSRILKVESGDGLSYMLVNLETPVSMDAVFSCLLMFVAVCIMCLSTDVLWHRVNSLLAGPIEGLLSCVKAVGTQIFQSVVKMATATRGQKSIKKTSAQTTNLLPTLVRPSDSPQAEDEAEEELKLLEGVLRKVSALTAILTRRDVEYDAAEADVEQLPADFKQIRRGATRDTKPQRRGIQDAVASVAVDNPDKEGDESDEEDMVGPQSWTFDIMELPEEQQLELVQTLLGASYTNSHEAAKGPRSSALGQSACIYAFVDEVARSHGDPDAVPFHNWMHAVDVTFTLHRVFKMCKVDRFFDPQTLFALSVAALCHDIGHFGKSNHFLIETQHDLALRYNDRSPLENMHCSRLFEIAGNPATAIFMHFDSESCRNMRHVIINAILHTDTQSHFRLVSEQQVAYEAFKDIFNNSADYHDDHPESWPDNSVIDVYCTQELQGTLRLSLVHFCDVSHSMKPWVICQYWTEKLTEEMFLEGDCEMKLGIPVQPTHDRSTSHTAQHQMSFIEFCICPLVISISKLLPPVHMCGEFALSNLEEWTNQCLERDPGAAEHMQTSSRLQKLRSALGKKRTAADVTAQAAKPRDLQKQGTTATLWSRATRMTVATNKAFGSNKMLSRTKTMLTAAKSPG